MFSKHVVPVIFGWSSPGYYAGYSGGLFRDRLIDKLRLLLRDDVKLIILEHCAMNSSSRITTVKE